MKTFIIIYSIGLALNALMAALVWEDLMKDRELAKMRAVSVVVFVIASFATWVYAMGYLLYKYLKEPKSERP